MNIAQLYEQELNHGANIIWKRMKANPENAEGIYREFIDFVCPDSHAEFLDTIKEGYPSEYEEFINTILETGFIQIHQPPMHDTIGLDGLKEMYKRFNIEKIKLNNIESPVIFGDVYYIKLRHEPVSKHSARSASHLSITGLPAKNNRNYKAGTEHHSSTAIRLGEQEIQNLLLSKDKEQVGKFIRIMSTDSDARHDMIMKLLKEQPFLTQELKVVGSGSNAVIGLKSFFNSIGLDLTKADIEKITNEVNDDE